ncbi:low molecular weight protein-tyrosine-phosphatase [Lentilactobacillus laojiaonis]|uniref:low molecular weight protein-tyrosine-phosphatase n=1 Tax=Lentilactobacillus laojiaonis TaxID=2883998 RepID=UPI001D0A45B7|nr:low molecular weight protein-tyrosine-phosphatase [Lentilactobacillus laojiaonis]UDM31928.1 low molecular weight phosphotyrosine protein phosphatase [Lentilactobacillus laojiaonis]
MTNVLFVCLGNICRSPMAEAMFKKMIAEQHLEQQIFVKSVATSSEEFGNSPHPGAQAEMDKHALNYAGHTSRPITKDDFKWADLIIGMDSQNIHQLKRIAPSQEDLNKIKLCYDILPDKQGVEIADPWYDHRFDRTYRQLSETLPHWLDFIKN